jgi:hypothetical protein
MTVVTVTERPARAPERVANPSAETVRASARRVICRGLPVTERVSGDALCVLHTAVGVRLSPHLSPDRQARGLPQVIRGSPSPL